MNLSYRKKLAVIAAVMALLVAGAVVITALTGARQKKKKDKYRGLLHACLHSRAAAHKRGGRR